MKWTRCDQDAGTAREGCHMSASDVCLKEGRRPSGSFKLASAHGRLVSFCFVSNELVKERLTSQVRLEADGQLSTYVIRGLYASFRESEKSLFVSPSCCCPDPVLLQLMNRQYSGVLIHLFPCSRSPYYGSRADNATI